MIQYFWEDLQSSIWAKIKQHKCKSDNFKKLIKKTKAIEAKVALRA